VNSGASERLAVPASCTTPAMLLIVIDMYIEYSGFQDMRRIHIIILHNIFKISYTGHNQSKLVPIAGKKFRFIIFIKKKKKKISRRLTIFVWKIRRTRIFFGVA
jgi:hypothetical protein